MNAGPGHLSRLQNWEDPTSTDDNIPNAQLFALKIVDDCYEYIMNFLTTESALDGFSTTEKKQFVVKDA